MRYRIPSMPAVRTWCRAEILTAKASQIGEGIFAIIFPAGGLFEKGAGLKFPADAPNPAFTPYPLAREISQQAQPFKTPEKAAEADKAEVLPGPLLHYGREEVAGPVFQPARKGHCRSELSTDNDAKDAPSCTQPGR